jgi:hypothetical protein
VLTLGVGGEEGAGTLGVVTLELVALGVGDGASDASGRDAGGFTEAGDGATAEAGRGGGVRSGEGDGFAGGGCTEGVAIAEGFSLFFSGTLRGGRSSFSEDGVGAGDDGGGDVFGEGVTGVDEALFSRGDGAG